MNLTQAWAKLRAFVFKQISDQRKYPRVTISVKVTHLKSGNFAYYMASNISVGGIFLLTEEPLSAGTLLRLQFSLPESKDMIEAEAEVIRIQLPGPDDPFPSGMGLQFVSLSPPDREAIADFVKKKI